MPLIDELQTVCNRLAPLGWRDLLLAVTAGQLDIVQSTTAALRAELAQDLPVIDRSHPGFEDFSRDGRQGITPGVPARSLVYHALASPNVLNDGAGVKLRGFPTLRELEVVENYVFGVQTPSVTELLQRVGQNELVIVVFAYEYRPARDTCSRLQADLAFSRAGISRVGTDPMLYDLERRGFWAEVATNPFGIRVCPARYGAFLSARVQGDRAKFLPMRHQELTPGTNPDGDTALNFWVPVHKLFDGTECLQGFDLRVDFTAFHVNEKIRRIHLTLGEADPPTTPPYRFTEGIADFVTGPDLCRGLLAPVPHERLVEPAVHDGMPVTFAVPANNGSSFGAFEPGVGQDEFGEVRPAPAYVHARTRVQDGLFIDLNNDPEHPNVLETVGGGGYEALHYVDFTGEGEVGATCDALAGHAGVAARSRPAYSLVAAPDFFPSSGQRELTEWTTSREVPVALRQSIWAVPPAPLCDIRLPANLQLPHNSFDPDEVTVTAVVPMLGPPITAINQPVSRDTVRHSWLPDDAAGVFAPGWDVSHDRMSVEESTIPHLAAYGLGSPFPEDAKLCAALSTFWPTVAPDASREMEPNPNPRLRATVAPLTDEEIGQVGSLPWDGNPGPKLVTMNGRLFAECESFFHLDYVQSALDGRFSLRLTAHVSAEEYERRVLAMALTYRVLGGNRNSWFLLSFLRVLPGTPELQQAQADAATVLSGIVYRCEIFRINSTQPSQPSSFRRRLLPINDRHFLFVDPQNRLVLQRRDTQILWTRAIVSL
jgi:hypothetical protein